MVAHMTIMHLVIHALHVLSFELLFLQPLNNFGIQCDHKDKHVQSLKC
jgi:hypothetical protein